MRDYNDVWVDGDYLCSRSFPRRFPSPLAEPAQHFAGDRSRRVADGVLKNRGGDLAFHAGGNAAEKRDGGGAVAEIFDVGPAVALQHLGQFVQNNVSGQRAMAQVNLQHFPPRREIGERNIHLLIESARRKTAGSSCQGQLVAPMNRIGWPLFLSNPSIP